jgi:acyl dehydratase
MKGKYFEDFEVGQEYVTRGLTITESHVFAFAGLSADFNPLHTDETVASKTPFGTRVAHGLLGLVVASGLINQLGLTEGTTLALLGFKDWQFKGPIKFGDTIRVKISIIDKKETSKPGRGIINRKLEVINQHDELVQSGESALMVMSRSKEQISS